MQYVKWLFESVFILCWLLVVASHGKSIDRCDFVHEIKRIRPHIDYQQLNAWTCIAQYQSNFNTTLENIDGSGISYHGLFQVSNYYWCSSDPSTKRACNIRCSQLHDTYLQDDFECVEKMYAEHLRLSGNGFGAWPIHGIYCSSGVDLIKDCLTSPDRTARTAYNKPFPFKDNAKAIAEKKIHKIYERCELARELYYVHSIPFEQVATWVCIAKYESNYNTSAIGNANGDGSMDHGLFQISDIYWCSPPGKGWVCGLSCAKLENSDISDDIACMMKIYEEHQRLSGNGFNAWSVYKPRCKHNVEQFIAGCFENDGANEVSLPMHKPAIFAPSTLQKNAFRKKTAGASKVFSRCELAQELRYKHNMPKDQIHTWICIAQTLSNFNTAVEAPKNADGSSSHGLFQISDQYWCDVNGHGKGCNINCNNLKDADISDDLECVKTIFAEHARLSGDGFSAWAPYEHHCKYERPESLQDCFSNEIINQSDLPPKPTPTSPPTTAAVAKSGKIYERCELARELRNVHNVPLDQIHTWVCIASHESRFDTSVIGRLNADGSLDHGLFQISDIYWCSNSGVGKGCNAACSDFRNTDISDDVRCIRTIHAEHQRLFGNGFHAWAVYEPHCRHITNQFTSDCFPNDIFVPDVTYTTAKPVTFEVSNAVGDQGRAYERCELAKELRHRHNVPQDQIADWVCIALYSSNLATSAKGQNSHGLFQISSSYWCSNSGAPGKQCNIECSKFEDSDITDDYQCAHKIYDTHQQLYGNGFSAWSVHEPYCSAGKSSALIEGCFSDINIPQKFSRPSTASPSYVLNVNYEENSIGFRDTVKKGKIYEKCELARELRYKYNVPLEHIHTWVCIVQRESNFDTSAIGRLNADGSFDHGLFQISDIYWCSNSGVGKGCNAACTDFENEDISDDVQCILRIFDEHQRLFGNGFHAWTTYEPYCKQTTSTHTNECFANAAVNQQVEAVTKKSFPAFVPFITTTQPPTQSPNTLAATLTPFNQFKYSTFAPISLSTQSTTKYPTATAQFVNYYTTSTTRKPSTTLHSFERPATISTKLISIPTYSSVQLTTLGAIPSIGTTKSNNRTFAVIRNSYFTSTTPKPYAHPLQLAYVPTSEALPASVTTKFNLFDLYLGRTTTKKPERYIIPTFASPKQPITHLSPYTPYNSFTTRPTPFLNTYNIPEILKPKTSTKKPTPEQLQDQFKAEVVSIAQQLGILNATFNPFDSVKPSTKPRVYRYSFSGTKAQTSH